MHHSFCQTCKVDDLTENASASRLDIRLTSLFGAAQRSQRVESSLSLRCSGLIVLHAFLFLCERSSLVTDVYPLSETNRKAAKHQSCEHRHASSTSSSSSAKGSPVELRWMSALMSCVSGQTTDSKTQHVTPGFALESSLESPFS